MNRYVFKITDFSQTSDSSINWQGCQRLILSWCIKQRNNLRVLPVQSYAFLEVWVLTSCLFCVRKQFCMIKMQKFAWEAVKYPRPTMGQEQFNGNSPVDREVAVHITCYSWVTSFSWGFKYHITNQRKSKPFLRVSQGFLSRRL